MSDRISSRDNQSPAARRDKSFLRGVNPVMKLAALVWVAVGLQAAASAQTTEKWNGSAGDGLWSDANNWTPNITGGPNGNYNVVVPLTGNPQPMLDVSATINNLEIDSLQSLTIINGSTLTVTGSKITNNGTLALNPNSGAPGGALIITGATTLSGLGTVQMEESSDVIAGPGTLTNQGAISGIGLIEVATLNNVKGATIQGTSSTTALDISSKTTVMNSGSISTEGFGTVNIFALTVQNAGGTISGGSGSTTLSGCAVTGGQLGGTIYSGGPRLTTTLNGVTITGNYYINSSAASRSQTILVGTITNIGSITVNGPPGALPAELTILSAATLTGTGTTSVNGENASLNGSGTFTNEQSVSSTGGGIIDVNQLANPGGAVTSFSSSLLVQVPGGINNTGGTFSAAGGTITVSGGMFFGGEVSANTGAWITWTEGVTISGGTTFLTGTHYGVTSTLNGVTIKIPSTFEVDSNDVTTLEGTNTNDGVVYLNGSCFSCPPATLSIAGPVVVNGDGTISLSNSPLNVIVSTGKDEARRSAVSDSLTNNGNTIQGAGTIGPLTLTNGTKGSIIADQGYPLIISPGAGNTFTNSGTLSAGAPSEPAGTLEITGGKFANFNLKTQTLKGGIYIVSGTLGFDNAAIVNNAANITLTGGGGQIVNQNGVNAFTGFNNNASTGKFTLANGQNFTTEGLFTNAGSLTIGKSSTLTVGGTSTNYNQTGGTTTVDGTLSVPAGGLVNVTGGTLEGAASVNGNVSVGNASGSAATLIVGDSIKTTASLSLANDYTQLATGIMDVQIGGVNPGTQYSQLTVTGPVSLQGTLNIKLINKFKPQVGETFTILTSPSSIAGTFATVNGTSISGTEHFAVAYNSDSVVLTVESGP